MGKIAQLLLILFLLGCNQYSSRQSLSQTRRLLNGNWVHSEDSLATVRVHNKTWIFYYNGEVALNKQQIKFTKSLPQYGDEKVKGEFILLIDKSDTTYYEVLGLNDSVLSLLHFPSGRIHVYSKKRDELPFFVN